MSMTEGNPIVGTVHRAPLDVVGSGFIKIVAANSATSSHASWELLAVEYDPEKPDALLSREGFRVTMEELRKWGGK